MVPKSWDSQEVCTGYRMPCCIPFLAVVFPPPSSLLRVVMLYPSYLSQEELFSPPFSFLEVVPFLPTCLS